MNRSAFALSLALLLPAFANAGEFYLSGSVGPGRVDFDKDEFDASFTDSGLLILESQLDENHAAWQLQLGYRLSAYIAVEGGYTSLGTYPYKAVVDAGGGQQLSFTVESKAAGVNLMAVGSLPLGQSFELFGSAGAIYHEISQTLKVGEPFNEELDNFEDTKVSPTFAAGLHWFGRSYGGERRVALRLAAQRFMNIGDEETTGETNVDVFWIGASFLW